MLQYLRIESIVISIGKIGENIVTSDAPRGTGTRRFHVAATACAKGRVRQIGKTAADHCGEVPGPIRPPGDKSRLVQLYGDAAVVNRRTRAYNLFRL